MGLLNSLAWLARNCLYALWRGNSQGRLAFLAAYIRVTVKHLCKTRSQSERIFGQNIHFFDYAAFASLFEELHLRDMYWFKADSASPVILDGGGNIGMAVLYLKRLYPAARIQTFEPDPQTCAMLHRNTQENSLTDVQIHNVALAAHDGDVSFYYDPLRPGCLGQSTTCRNLSRVAVKEVPARRLSSFIEGPVDLLKLDIEGAENDVIAELAASGKLSLIREMIVEYHLHINFSDDHLGQFLFHLESAGFGYQIRAPLPLPFRQRGEFQSMILYVYQK